MAWRQVSPEKCLEGWVPRCVCEMLVPLYRGYNFSVGGILLNLNKMENCLGFLVSFYFSSKLTSNHFNLVSEILR